MKDTIFVPISLGGKKLRLFEKSRLLEVYPNDLPYDVLEEFRLSTNRNKILEDVHGTKYQLVTLEMKEELTTYQRFVFSSIDDVYRIGTKEPHVRILQPPDRDWVCLAAPVVERVFLSTLQLLNPF